MRTKQAADAIGIAPDTLRRWDRLGILRPRRDELGERLYTDEDIVFARQILEQNRLCKGYGLLKRLAP